MTSIRLRLMPREKQYLAKKAELVSTVYASVQHFGIHDATQLVTALTFPPKTSSPIMRHAAVWIMLLLRCSAMFRAVNDPAVDWWRK